MKETNNKLVMIGLMIGLVLSAFDQTVMTTAMPTIASSLGSMSLYSWGFSAYMLMEVSGTPIFGKLADLFGRRQSFLLGMGLFLLGSILCGFSQSMVQLIIFRGIQGLGAGALLPLAFTIVSDIFPPEERGKMQGVAGSAFGIASLIGPAIGGVITQYFGWNWIFFTNVPLGLVSAGFVLKGLKEIKVNKKPYIDFLGAFILVCSIISLLLTSVWGGSTYAWFSPQIIGLIALGLVLLIVFVFVERGTKEPIIPLYIFKKKVINFSNITMFFFGVGFFGTISYVPLFVQTIIGKSTSVSGYVLTPMVIAMIISSIVGGTLTTKFSFRSLISSGMAVIAVGLFMYTTMGPSTSYALVCVYTTITGLGMGLVLPNITLAIQEESGDHDKGIITSTNSLFRAMGGTLGVCILGTVLNTKLSQGVVEALKTTTSVNRELLDKILDIKTLTQHGADSNIPQGILSSVKDIFSNSINMVFVFGLIFIIVGLIFSLFLGNKSLKKVEPIDTDLDVPQL